MQSPIWANTLSNFADSQDKLLGQAGSMASGCRAAGWLQQYHHCIQFTEVTLHHIHSVSHEQLPNDLQMIEPGY